MGIQQKAGSLTPAMAVLVCGVLLIAGCSDGSKSSGGASFQRNFWTEGNFASLTNPQDTQPPQALMPGESYTFTWIGGSGSLATINLQLWVEEQSRFVTQHKAANIRNVRSYRMLLPSSLPRGLYSVSLETFNNHVACYQAGAVPSSYYTWSNPKALAYSPTRNRTGMGGSGNQAIEWCNNPGAGCTDPVYCAPTNDCQLVDVNNSLCKTGTGGISLSHFFTIGPVDQGVVDQALAYLQIENSQSNQAAAAAQSKNTDEQAAPTPANVVQVSNENDAKDDKSVTHIANSGVAGGR